MIGSYTITMDSNTSSSMEGQIQVELLDQTHGQSKNEILEQVEGHGEGEGQGKPQSQISDQGSGQFQLGAQDSLEECMAQVGKKLKQ